MTSEEGVHSFQYLSSISESGGVPSSESSRKDVVVVGSLSNNNNNNFVVIKPEPVFEPYPENGLSQEEQQRSQDGGGGGDERSSSDVNNPLSLTPAFTTATSLPEEGSQSQQLINNNNNNTIISSTKITSNHLSVKHYRDAAAPYPATLHHLHKRSRTSPPQVENFCPLRASSTGGVGVEQGDMYDSVMVSSNIHVNNSASSGQAGLGLNGDILVPSSNHIHHHQPSKLEPNGNNIEIQLMGSHQPQQQQPNNPTTNQLLHEADMMMMHGGSNQCEQRHNSSSSSYSSGGGPGSDSVIMGLLHGNNSSSLLSSSSLGPGGGSTLLVMSHGNGVSLTSPGGSLEDQDCDEEK